MTQTSSGTTPGGADPNAAPERIPAAQRRELILASASEVFGERGYAGATTDQIARAAGISQPYVVRMFGTKEKLFLEVLERALRVLMEEFRAVIARNTDFSGPRPALTCDMDGMAGDLGRAYVGLVADRGILMSLMQAFVQGHDRVIGEAARYGFLEIYRLLRDEAGFDPVTTRDFLANGMLLNTLLGIQLPSIAGSDPLADELMDVTFGGKLGTVLGVVGPDSRQA